MKLQRFVPCLALATFWLMSCDTSGVPYRLDESFIVNRPVEQIEAFTPPCTLDRGDENSWTQFPDYHDREKYLPVRGTSPIAVHYGEIRTRRDSENRFGHSLFFFSYGWGCFSRFREERISIDLSTSSQQRSRRRTGYYNLNVFDTTDGTSVETKLVDYFPMNDDAVGPRWIQDFSFENRFTIHAETDSTMTVSFSVHVIREDLTYLNHPQAHWTFIPLRLHVWMEPTEVRRVWI